MEFVTIAYIAVSVIALVLMNLPGLSWRRIEYGKEWRALTLNRPTGLKFRLPIFNIPWPLSNAVEFYTLPGMVEMEAFVAPVGKDPPVDLPIGEWDIECEIGDTQKAYDLAPHHDPIGTMKRLAQTGVTAFTTTVDIKALRVMGMHVVCEHVKAELQGIVGEWGVTIKRVVIEDVQWPAGLLAASDEVLRAQGQAAAILALAEARAREVELLKAKYGPDWLEMFLELERTKQAQAGAWQYVGGGGSDGMVLRELKKLGKAILNMGKGGTTP